MTIRLIIVALSIGLALSVAGCGASDNAPQPTPTLPIAEETRTPARASSAPPKAEVEEVISLVGIEDRVKADLAAALGVPVERIALAEVITQPWPDQGLGCGTPGDVIQAVPAPGYQIALEYGDETYRYHADRQGRFVRCVAPDKPLGPILK
jgi:hypothetical protein